MPRTRLSAAQRQAIHEIRSLYRDDEPLNLTAVKRKHPELVKRVYGIKPFWGWKQALDVAGIDYGRIRIRLEPYVRCEICGDHVRVLFPHLHWKHKSTSDEYRESYPGAELVSEEVRAYLKRRPRRGKAAASLIPHWEPVWSPEYALDRIAELHRLGYDLNTHAVSRRDAVWAYATKCFGSWDEALKRAGLDPAQIRRLPPWREWTAEQVLSRIRERHRNGLPMLAKAVRLGKQADCMLWKKAQFHFHSWPAAVERAGLARALTQHVRSVRYPTRQSVLRGIEDRRRKGWPLNHVALLRGTHPDTALLQSGQEFFGSWPAAIAAAGYDYERIRSNHRIVYLARAEVIQALRQRQRRGWPVTGKSVRRGPHKNSTLYHAARQFFPNWAAALAAAHKDDPAT